MALRMVANDGVHEDVCLSVAVTRAGR